MIEFMDGKLKVLVHKDVKKMAEAAAKDVGNKIILLLNEKKEINIVFSGAKSQQEFHKELTRLKGIDWNRINVFTVDEFYCPGMNAEYAVARQPMRDLFDIVKPKSINIIDFEAKDAEAERQRFEALIRNHPADIVCLGIGVSGHIALNEPGQTDFNDKFSVRVVDITEESKEQLMNDPNFMKLGIIPDKGITTTMSQLMKCSNVFVVVPYAEKAEIIQKFFKSEITTDLPASILKSKDNAVMYLDEESYGLCMK